MKRVNRCPKTRIVNGMTYRCYLLRYRGKRHECRFIYAGGAEGDTDAA